MFKRLKGSSETVTNTLNFQNVSSSAYAYAESSEDLQSNALILIQAAFRFAIDLAKTAAKKLTKTSEFGKRFVRTIFNVISYCTRLDYFVDDITVCLFISFLVSFFY